jgi:hypothetical protein
MGFDIRVAGDAVAYHRHSATSGRQPRGQKRFLMERNALWTAVKRYGDAALDRVFGATLLLTARRIAQEARVNLDSTLAQSLAPFSSRCRRRGRTTSSFEALYETPTSPSAASAWLGPSAARRELRGCGRGTGRSPPRARGGTTSGLALRARPDLPRFAAAAGPFTRRHGCTDALPSPSTFRACSMSLACCTHEALALNAARRADARMGRAPRAVARSRWRRPTLRIRRSHHDCRLFGGRRLGPATARRER